MVEGVVVVTIAGGKECYGGWIVFLSARWWWGRRWLEVARGEIARLVAITVTVGLVQVFE
ncbi:Hypothetical predicted protein, partial [Olea europaea subsp. europaea]